MADDEARDLFGRKESEIERSIAEGEQRYGIAKVYGGNEGLAINLARLKAGIEVDRRCLKLLRGERVVWNPALREMTAAQLSAWRKNIVRLGSAGHTQRRSKA